MSVSSSWVRSIGGCFGGRKRVCPQVCVSLPCSLPPWLFDGSESSALLLGSCLTQCARAPAICLGKIPAFSLSSLWPGW